MFDVTQIPSISLANEGNRRDPKQGRTPGEQILSSTDALISAQWCPELGPNSAQVSLSGTGGSNPPRSANESLRIDTGSGSGPARRAVIHTEACLLLIHFTLESCKILFG